MYYEKFLKDSTFLVLKFLVIQQKGDYFEGYFDYVVNKNKTNSQVFDENVAEKEIVFGIENKLICGINSPIFQIRYTIDYQKLFPIENCKWKHVLTCKKDDGISNFSNQQTQNFYSTSACELDGGTLVTIDWYWQVFEDGVLISETYLYSTQECIGGSGQSNPIPSIPTSSTGFCGLTNEEAQAALSNITIQVSGLASITNSGPTYGPDENQIYRKAVTCTGTSMTMHFDLGLFVKYKVFYKEVIYKNGVNGEWLWESFSFDKVMKTDGAVPPCLSIDVNRVVSTMLDTDKKKHMVLAN